MGKHWGALLGFAEVAAGALLFLAFTQMDDFARLEPQARAAWVGAIGSITSLIVAASVGIGVSIYNNARSARLAAEALKANRSAALAVMHFMQWRMFFTIKGLAKVTVSKARIIYLNDMLDATVEAFERFNPVVIADEAGVLDFYRFRNEVLRVRRHFAKIVERDQGKPIAELRTACAKFGRSSLPKLQSSHRRMTTFRRRYDLPQPEIEIE